MPSGVVMSTSIDLKGKVCLVTGVTQGIGRAAALSIAKHGPKMVLVARDAKRGGEVADEIKAAGNPNVELMVADLSSQADIRRLAAEFKARYQQLHLLVNNAGAVYTERQLSKDGIELTWALNHLGYFLLTELLLDVGGTHLTVVIHGRTQAQPDEVVHLEIAADVAGKRAHVGAPPALGFEHGRGVIGHVADAECVDDDFARFERDRLAFPCEIVGPIAVDLDR